MAKPITDSVYCPECCFEECPALDGDWSDFYEATEQEYNNWQRGGTVTITAKVVDGFANDPACEFEATKSVTFGPRLCNPVLWYASRPTECEYGQGDGVFIEIALEIFKTQNYGYRIYVGGLGWCSGSLTLNFPPCYSCAPSLFPYTYQDDLGAGSDDYPKSILFGRTFYNYRVCPNDNYIHVKSFEFVPA